MVIEVRLTVPLSLDQKKDMENLRSVALEMGVNVVRVKVRDDSIQLYGNKEKS